MAVIVSVTANGNCPGAAAVPWATAAAGELASAIVVPTASSTVTARVPSRRRPTTSSPSNVAADATSACRPAARPGNAGGPPVSVGMAPAQRLQLAGHADGDGRRGTRERGRGGEEGEG